MQLFKYLVLLLFIFIQSNHLNAQKTIDSLLVRELKEMMLVDQLAATNANPPQEFSGISQDAWNNKKDSIYRTHQARLAEMLTSYGYPGYDLVGKQGETWYWLMVQHADFDVEFQKAVLKEMSKAVEAGNADPQNYAYLTDRIHVNQGQKQVYGTQVTYNFLTGQAMPRDLMASEKVNDRRASVGLEPIEVYLTEMTEMHMAGTLTGIMTNQALLILIIGLVMIVLVWVRRKRRSPR